MKKVLFLMLAVALGMSGFAQRATVSKDLKMQSVTLPRPSELRVSDGTQAQAMQFTMPQTMVNTTREQGGEWDEYFTAMTTNYDLQSNSALGNRIAVWPDGTASFTATWDHSGNTGYPDRGTGYNFYDGEDMGPEPEGRQESIKSGWPTIAACGEGEFLASHGGSPTSVNIYYRPTKGQGEWTLKHTITDATWARIGVSGPNNEYIHVVCALQITVGDGYDNHVYYVRSTDGGETWSEKVDFPGLNNDADGDYRNQLSADDYVMATNGNNVAVMFSAYTTEVFYMISHDNGETWERQIIAPYPILDDEGNAVHAIDFDDYPEGMTDSISTSDGSHSIAIDNNGVVHATFGLFHWQVADSDSYTYWPMYGYGLVYWNSEYTNEQGGHEIPLYGDFSGDADHPEWAANGMGHTLLDERIVELAYADNYEHLQFFGQVDENGNGSLDFENVTGLTWHYRSFGWATMPSISVDNQGSLAIIFNAYSETRVNPDNNFHMRSAYILGRDSKGTWFGDETPVVNFGDDIYFELSNKEMYPTVACDKAYDGTFFFYFSGDENQGLYLDISDTYPNSNGATLTENYIYAVKFTPAMEGWDGVVDHSFDNPMTSARVYPNPVNGILNVEVNASMNSDATLSVYNIMGQKVAEQNANLYVGPNTASINTSELSSGVYFVTVKANGFEKTMKFVVK